MLTSFSVENFKTIGRRVKLDLGRVNVLVGSNGSGKTNILEAFAVLACALNGRVNDDLLLKKGARVSPSSLYLSANKALRSASRPAAKKNVVTFEARWKNIGQVTYEVELIPPGSDEQNWSYRKEILKTDGQKDLERIGPRPTLYIPQEEGGRKRVGWPLLPDDVGLLGRLLGQPVLLDDGTGRAAMYTGFLWADDIERVAGLKIYEATTRVLQGNPDDRPDSPVGLSGGRLPEAVEELFGDTASKVKSISKSHIKRLLDWMSDFEVIKTQRDLLPPSVAAGDKVLAFSDRYVSPKTIRFSSYLASEGASFILFTLVLAMHKKTPGFFALDNFDRALNPRAARELGALFCEAIEASGKQALITTHNPLVLDAFDLTEKDQSGFPLVRLFAVDRNRNGCTIVRPVEIDLKKHLEDGIPLSRLWTSGMIGGMPG